MADRGRQPLTASSATRDEQCAMSFTLSNLILATCKVVRELPLAPFGMNAKRNGAAKSWRGGSDYRVVCDCQRHGLARSTWRRSLHFASRGLAVLVAVPLAFGALGIPMEAMDLDLPQMSKNVRASVVATQRGVAQPARELTLITSNIREQFLDAAGEAPQLTFDAIRRQFFYTHVPYGRLIYDEAKKNGLPPELVAAMISTESDFRATLISNRDAQGLMQIRPSTGRLLGAENLLDPATNIAAGTKYFRYLLNHYGDQQMALAAYNAGMGNVAKFGGVPPFAETQNYLRRVTARASQYHKRVRTTYLTSARMERAVTSIQ
jgi:flagellar biosynthesis regulator FlaF